MLSLPDLQEKKLLFIQTENGLENNLKYWNSNLTIYKEGKKINQISVHLVLGLFIVGEFTITSYLIRDLIKHGISIFLLSNNLSTYAVLNSNAEGNTVLRSMQYNSTEGKELQLAKYLVKQKLVNQLSLLNQYKINSNLDLKDLLIKVENAQNIDSLRGIEGSVASKYFKLLFKDIGWQRRAPTTKEDILNLLLDIGYSYLFNLIDSLLRLFGFDTYKGVFHQLFFQRKSLSCDLMEPFRPLIDKALKKAYNLGRIKEEDFVYNNHRFEFKEYDSVKKYTAIFFEVLMDEKDAIYIFILNYYRYLHDENKYNLNDVNLF